MLWKTNCTYGLRKEKNKDSIGLTGVCLQKTTKNNRSLKFTAVCSLKLASLSLTGNSGSSTSPWVPIREWKRRHKGVHKAELNFFTHP